MVIDGWQAKISERVLCHWPYADLRVFSHIDPRRDQNLGPILVIAPLAGAFPVLLRDLVISLLRETEQVAVADWFDVRYLPLSRGRFGFDENISSIVDMIRLLGPDVNVIGVCQGVVSALAATAYLSAREPYSAPRSAVLIGGPVDPLANPTAVVQRLRSHSLEWLRKNAIVRVPEGVPGEGRLVYPKMTQLATFTSYLMRHCLEGKELYWKLFADDGEDPLHFPFLSLATQLMDLPAEHFLENIRCIFHDRDLVSGTFFFANTRIDLQAIKNTALMTMEGERDDIAAPGQTQAAQELCRSIPSAKRRHILIEGCGHFSLFHGHICRTRVVPEIMGFLHHEART
ncbi:polyhydroxyalkanoate depolymerase [Beijerinckia indica]|uniref:polyhydroxyalkanoate depolymerase n=1 Tax=Beijerinckia indica TaxID=533 RepID=UPI0013052CFB